MTCFLTMFYVLLYPINVFICEAIYALLKYVFNYLEEFRGFFTDCGAELRWSDTSMVVLTVC